MTFIFNVIVMILIAFVLHYWWQSGEYKARAMDFALQHCRQLGLQLLDQSMVIRGYWPVRLGNGRWLIRRTYQFEFTSTGQQRYRGSLVLFDKKLDSIALEAYQLPE